MQTDENAERYMVAISGFRGTNLVSEMRVFDYECDAREYILSKLVRRPVTIPTHSQFGKTYVHIPHGMKVYLMSPVKPPKLKRVTHKWLGVEEFE